MFSRYLNMNGRKKLPQECFGCTLGKAQCIFATGSQSVQIYWFESNIKHIQWQKKETWGRAKAFLSPKENFMTQNDKQQK